MASQWIKFEHVTPDKPEVDAMANALKIDPDTVVGKLLRFWIWADQQSISGNGLTVTKTLLDRITYCPGFSDSLISVGWLEEVPGGFSIPNFDRHNGESAKSRATTQKRVQKHRDSGNENVTLTPLPEKRREEKIISVPKKKKHAFEDSPLFDKKTFKESFPTWDTEKCREWYTRAVEYSGANGGRYLDWKLAIQAWERKQAVTTTPKKEKLLG